MDFLGRKRDESVSGAELFSDPLTDVYLITQ